MAGWLVLGGQLGTRCRLDALAGSVQARLLLGERIELLLEHDMTKRLWVSS